MQNYLKHTKIITLGHFYGFQLYNATLDERKYPKENNVVVQLSWGSEFNLRGRTFPIHEE